MIKVFKNCVQFFCSMMRDNQLLSVQEWPEKCGGGLDMTQSMIVIILKIFNLPFNLPCYEKEVEEISG